MSKGGAEVAPLSRKQIRALADGVREYFNVKSAKFPIVEVVELVLPRVYKGFLLEVLPEAEMGDNHGLTMPEYGVIQIREDVYNRARAGEGRDRMTIAHEFGHLLLHQGVALARSPSGIALPAYKDPEWQAKAFAGELLISHRHLAKCREAIDLVSRFGVSSDAAEIQWRAFKKEGTDREAQKMKEPEL